MPMLWDIPQGMVKAGTERDIKGGNVLRFSEKNPLFLLLMQNTQSSIARKDRGAIQNVDGLGNDSLRADPPSAHVG